MQVTLDLDDVKVRELMRLLDARTTTEAIGLAIDECLRAGRRSRLKLLAGRVQLAEDWRALRELDRAP